MLIQNRETGHSKNLFLKISPSRFMSALKQGTTKKTSLVVYFFLHGVVGMLLLISSAAFLPLYHGFLAGTCRYRTPTKYLCNLTSTLALKFTSGPSSSPAISLVALSRISLAGLTRHTLSTSWKLQPSGTPWKTRTQPHARTLATGASTPFSHALPLHPSP